MKNIKLPVLAVVFALFTSASLFSQENERLIKDYISAGKALKLQKSDLTDFTVINVDASKSLNADVVKIQQSFNGLPIYGAVATVVIKDRKVSYFKDNFQNSYVNASARIAGLDKKSAFSKLLQNLSLYSLKNYPVLEFNDADPENALAAKQRLVYAKINGNLVLSYEFLVPEEKTNHYWNVLVDANSGAVLSKIDLNLSCNFNHNAYTQVYPEGHKIVDHNEPLLNIPEDNKAAQSLLVPDNASYNVFQLPIEAPSFGSRTMVSNPWIVASSPEGWHFNGTTHYTITRGNNVFAYEDRDANNIAGSGSSPDGGAARNFNFPYNSASTPFNSLSAATTNLFYINNKVHDIFYKFGFNESARNFQQTNFGFGGLGNDYVNAESQDRGGYNNANFATPADGSRPRMQMYLWQASSRRFWYNAPSAAVSRVPTAGTSDFGDELDDIGVTGDVALSPVLLGCSALPAGSLTGKIGLIERGTCTFTEKVKNAQNAGAIAAIIYNNTGGAALTSMNGTDNTITIPSVIINNAEGEYIKTQLSGTVNVTLKRDIRYDGSFDNGIVAHEYGHGISNRNTGDGYTCLSSSSSKEQMGEGWSDFFALMLTNKPGDNASVARGIGTYAIGQANSGSGIRPAKYSPLFTVNDYTYNDTNGMEYDDGSGTMVPDVHSIGFVWATILWDLHWNFVQKYGYTADVSTNTTSGSSRVLQLVTDALKLQPCNPDFVTGRDAVLAAELLATGGADRCMIWRTFAKRGVGLNASAGSATDINDQLADFTVPAECFLATEEGTANAGISIYPNPAKNEFSIKLPSKTLGKVKVDIYDASGKLVAYQTMSGKESISTQNLPNGVYVVKIKGINVDYSSKLMIRK
ncbi:T9SS-dependent M36 family metallopeptidase [Chryseobacterium sp.]|uniref:T9SS-dependent M36 family metallopeptidase n=1 Tax=Chryseobacterium sp. TaxID=1871047 RepID=UPI0011C99BA8|nr:T9SS-dependent M36 family metallopeptidase [Chryseobacterium sp.]TXF77725.1 T9SS type A sorting domain-containing protein [Chryseobacterium sp.]